MVRKEIGPALCYYFTITRSKLYHELDVWTCCLPISSQHIFSICYLCCHDVILIFDGEISVPLCSSTFTYLFRLHLMALHQPFYNSVWLFESITFVPEVSVCNIDAGLTVLHCLKIYSFLSLSPLFIFYADIKNFRLFFRDLTKWDSCLQARLQARSEFVGKTAPSKYCSVPRSCDRKESIDVNYWVFTRGMSDWDCPSHDFSSEVDYFVDAMEFFTF